MSIRLKPGQMATLDKPYRILRHRYNDLKKCRHKLVGANSPGSIFISNVHTVTSLHPIILSCLYNEGIKCP